MLSRFKPNVIEVLSLSIELFILSFLFSVLSMPIFIRLAFWLGITDNPDSNLKRHDQVTPYLGGVVIFLAFALCSFLFLPLNFENGIYILGCFTLMIVGLLDDLYAMTPFSKTIGHLIALISFISIGFVFKAEFLFSILNIMASIFWYLLVINAINLVDVMDGLSSAVSMTAILAYICLAILQGSSQLLVYSISLFGAILGFFIFNKPKARIYMGDSGALFVGGALASFPFFVSWSEANWYGFLSPMIILFIPLYEVAALVLIRSYKKIPFFLGSRDHFCHYMMDYGETKWGILKRVFSFGVILSIIGTSVAILKLSFVLIALVLFIIFIAWMLSCYPKQIKNILFNIKNIFLA